MTLGELIDMIREVERAEHEVKEAKAAIIRSTHPKEIERRAQWATRCELDLHELREREIKFKLG